MQQTADVIVIGAGIIGLSAALQLAKRNAGKIVVLERGDVLGGGSTGASSAVCRHLYTRPEMVRLARDGVATYRAWGEFLDGVDAPTASFQHAGVLWMGLPDAEREQRRLAEFDVAAAVLDDAELKARFPALNPCLVPPDLKTGEDHPCAGGGVHLFETSGGFMDPQYALEDLAKALAAQGVPIVFGCEVTEVLTVDGRIAGVRCANEVEYACGQIINASGPWCNRLLEPLGLSDRWPLIPTRIQILYLDRPPELAGDIPVCGDLVAGIYFRVQNRGQQLIVGSTLPEDEEERVGDPDSFNRLADDEFAALKLHALHHRLPALSYRGKVGGYSGLYTINRSDMHPVVGRTPVEGFVVANGFSGHGFKLAPAIGSLIAQTVTGERIASDTDVPIEFLGWDRAPIGLDTKSVLA